MSKSQQERSVALETSAYYKFLNTYFSLRAKCWLRGGVGRQFPGTSYNDLPFNIVNLSKAIKRQRTAEYKVLQFSRIFTTIFKTQRWVVFSVDLTYWRIKTSSSSITSTICNGTNFELLILSFTG